MTMHAPAMAADAVERQGRPPLPLSVRDLSKRYGDVVALSNITLDIRPGEFFALLGPSGCGKTTLLRSIAGIIRDVDGEIILGGENIAVKPLNERDTALVFQNYALFPHMTVFENVAFGLKMRKRPAAEIRARVAEALELVQLPHLAKRLPRELSGGQQQRVALARAMVVRPAVLLLDEPLSNLDARLRDEMRREIRRLQKALGVTTILVTHDIEEALTVADRLAVMRQGRVEQVGTPAEIYEAPASRFTAEFVGHANVLAGTIAEASTDGVRVTLDTRLDLAARNRDGGWRAGDAVWATVPAERIRLGSDAAPMANRYDAVVEDIAYLGGFRQVTLAAGGVRLLARQQNIANVPLQPGQRVAIGWDAGDTIVLPSDGPEARP